MNFRTTQVPRTYTAGKRFVHVFFVPTALYSSTGLSVCSLPSALTTVYHLCRTALHFAAHYGHMQVAKDLLATGARKDIFDGAGFQPKDYAELYGHATMAEEITKFTYDLQYPNFEPDAELCDDPDSVWTPEELEAFKAMPNSPIKAISPSANAAPDDILAQYEPDIILFKKQVEYIKLQPRWGNQTCKKHKESGVRVYYTMGACRAALLAFLCCIIVKDTF